MTVKERNRNRKIQMMSKQIREAMATPMPFFRMMSQDSIWQGGTYHVPIQVPVVIDEGSAYPSVINSGAALRAASEREADRAIRAGEPVYPFYPWNGSNNEE